MKSPRKFIAGAPLYSSKHAPNAVPELQPRSCTTRPLNAIILGRNCRELTLLDGRCCWTSIFVVAMPWSRTDSAGPALSRSCAWCFVRETALLYPVRAPRLEVSRLCLVPNPCCRPPRGYVVTAAVDGGCFPGLGCGAACVLRHVRVM